MAATWQPSSTASGSVRPNFAVGTRDRSHSQKVSTNIVMCRRLKPQLPRERPRGLPRVLSSWGLALFTAPPGPQVAPGPVIGPERPMLPSTPRE